MLVNSMNQIDAEDDMKYIILTGCPGGAGGGPTGGAGGAGAGGPV